MAESYPAGVSTFTVVGRLAKGVADGPDVGQAPDMVPVPGATVTFTPDLTPPIFTIPTATEPVTVFQESIVATTDADGWLIAVGETTRGIVLPYGLDPDITPNGWTWRVDLNVGGNFPTRTFHVTGSAGGTINLSSVIPVAANPGADIPNWQSVTATVTAARDATIAARDATLQAIEDFEPGTGGGGLPANTTLDTIPEGTTSKRFTDSEKAKLAGIFSGATANSSDAALRDRSTHSGSQPSTTISDFATAADARITANTTLVRLTGNQTLAGVKTFSSAPVVPDSSFSISKTAGLQSAIDARAPLAALGGVVQVVYNGSWPAARPAGASLVIAYSTKTEGAPMPPWFVAGQNAGDMWIELPED